MKQLFIILISLSLGLTINAQRSCDLQVVSVSPSVSTVSTGQTFYVELQVKNNGPDVLPEDEATAQITISNKYLTVPTNKYLNFQSDYWKIVKIKRSTKYGHVNIFLKNKEELPINVTDNITLNLKGRSQGSATVSVVSSLSGRAKSSDPDGSNQSAYFLLPVNKILKFLGSTIKSFNFNVSK